MRRWMVGAALAAITALAVVAVVALVGQDERRVQLPPGCSKADSLKAGCRPVATERSSDNTVAIITIIVTPLGAFAVALLAAGAARSRQDRDIAEARRALSEQLAAEGDRQRTLLDDESDRLARQLEHDRAMRDLEELRSLLDEASDALGVLANWYKTVRSGVARLSAAPSATAIESGKERIKTFRKADDTCTRISERLVLRLGEDSEVVTAFRKSLLARRRGIGEVLGYTARKPTDDEHERLEEADREATAAHVGFFRASYALVHSSLSPAAKDEGAAAR